MTHQPQQDVDKAAMRRGRLTAAAIMLVVALPLLAAIVVFYTGMGMPAGTSNAGDLLTPPQPVAQLRLQELGENELWDIAQQRRRWRMLIPGFEGCDTQCQQNLYLTRQVHVRLANDAYRMERFFLLRDDETLDPEMERFLAEEHPGLRVMRVAENDFRAMLAQTNKAGSEPVAKGHYYLMDQQGFLMMVYNPKHSGNQLLADIKRMLKVTYED